VDDFTSIKTYLRFRVGASARAAVYHHCVVVLTHQLLLVLMSERVV